MYTAVAKSHMGWAMARNPLMSHRAAVEDLEGIRNRTRFRKKQRDCMSKWAFAELRGYIEYKAALAGVKVIPVNSRDASKRCPACNHVSGKNRIRRDVFLCDECRYFEHAEIVGAKNIRSGASAIMREVPVAAAGRVSRETISICYKALARTIESSAVQVTVLIYRPMRRLTDVSVDLPPDDHGRADHI